MSFSSGTNRQSSLRGAKPYIPPLQMGWVDLMSRIMDNFAEEDIWWVTLVFGIDLPPRILENRRKAFTARLQQGLRDAGGGTICFSIVSALQQRGVPHYHLIISGEGLGRLDKSKWEKRWKRISNYDGSSSEIYQANLGSPRYMVNKHNFSEDKIQVMGHVPSTFSSRMKKS